MTSTSLSTGTGLKKCIPITCSGRFVAIASLMIGIDDVFVARIASSLATTSSRWRNTVDLLGLLPRAPPRSTSVRSASSSKRVANVRFARAHLGVLLAQLPGRHRARRANARRGARPASSASASRSTTTTSRTCACAHLCDSRAHEPAPDHADLVHDASSSDRSRADPTSAGPRNRRASRTPDASGSVEQALDTPMARHAPPVSTGNFLPN